MDQIKEDRRAINEVLAILAEAWNTGDANLFSSKFSADADYITFNGQHLKGRSAIAESHDSLWKTFLKSSTLVSTEELKIRFVTDTLAIVHGTGAVLKKGQKAPSKNRLSINTNVFIKKDGIWEITAFHNCRIQELPWFLKMLMKFKKP